MITELSTKEIIKIHEKLVKRFTITDGVLNRSNLELIVARPDLVIIINNKKVFPDVYSKAALPLEGII